MKSRGGFLSLPGADSVVAAVAMFIWLATWLAWSAVHAPGGTATARVETVPAVRFAQAAAHQGAVCPPTSVVLPSPYGFSSFFVEKETARATLSAARAETSVFMESNNWSAGRSEEQAAGSVSSWAVKPVVRYSPAPAGTIAAAGGAAPFAGIEIGIRMSQRLKACGFVAGAPRGGEWPRPAEPWIVTARVETDSMGKTVHVFLEKRADSEKANDAVLASLYAGKADKECSGDITISWPGK